MHVAHLQPSPAAGVAELAEPGKAARAGTLRATFARAAPSGENGPMDCRILLAQTNPRLGDVHANLSDHVERIARAVAKGCELVVFPELSLTGYFLKDQVFELGLALDAEPIERLAQASRDVSIVFGCVERTREERFYNSLVFVEDGEIKGVHRKVHLVSYGMFDEARDFAAGERFELFHSKHGRFGPLLCEDFWHVPSSYLHFLNDADALLIASASPARGAGTPGPGLASQRTWEQMLAASALFYRTWVIYAARVGWEDGVGFGGHSALFDPFGQRVASLEGFEPGNLWAKIDPAALRRARVETPLRRDEKPWLLAAGLERYLSDREAEKGSGR